MESYNTIFRYFFPFLFFLQYFGCNSYHKAMNMSIPAREDTVEVVQLDCSDLKEYTYNGFYAPSDEGKLFTKKDTYAIDSIHVAPEPILDMSDLKSVKKTFDAMGNPSIQVTFTEKGRLIFKEYTVNNIQKKIAIIVKDQLVTAPVINAEIPGGKVEISGVFLQKEVDNMHEYLSTLVECSKPRD